MSMSIESLKGGFYAEQNQIFHKRLGFVTMITPALNSDQEPNEMELAAEMVRLLNITPPASPMA